MSTRRHDPKSARAPFPRIAGLALACLVAVAMAAPPPGQAQEVRVTREQLLRRFPRAAQPSVATVTRGGVDSLRFDAGAITVGRDRFLTIATGEPLEVVPGVLTGPIEAAPPLGRPAGPSARPQRDAVEGEAAGEVARADSVTAAPGQLTGDRLVLPYRYLTADARGEDLWVLRPVFQAQGPLRFDDGVFRGTFYLAMEDSANRGESRPLEVPIRLRVLAQADTLAPDVLTFERTNFPLKQVHLAATRVRDSLRIRIIPEFDLDGTDVWVAVEPSLVIETPPRRIQGLGIESAPVTVSVRGGSLQEPVTVFFESDRGSFEPGSVVLTPAQGSARVRLRSAGIGPASIRAFAPGLGEGSVVFAFTWPLPFLVAAVLGGLTGGLGATVMAKDGAAPDLRRALLRGLVLGLLAAVVYYAVGISLLQVDVGVERFNEAAVFAFAALAGLFGLRAPKAHASAGEPEVV